MVCIKLINAKKGRDRKQYTTAASKEINLEKVPLLTKDRALKQANSSYLQTKDLKGSFLFEKVVVYFLKDTSIKDSLRMKFSEISLFGNQYELALRSSLQLQVQNSVFEIPFYFHCNSIDIFSQEKSSKDTKVKNC